MNDTTNIPSTATTILNYIMNRYMPFVCVAGLLFCTLGFDSWLPYAIIGFMWFATSYAFRCGIAHVLCDPECVSKIDEDNVV